MKNKPFGVFVLSILVLLVGTMLVDSAIANMIPPEILPVITIGSDGSISPETELISRNGNTYTLTADVQEYPVVIECSNIVFDGAGHTINVTTGDNSGLRLGQVKDVTVKNLTVYSRNIYSISLDYSYNCLITEVQTSKYVAIKGDYNNVTKSNTGVGIFTGSNNLIERNNITALGVDGYSNIFSRNNIILTEFPYISASNFWDYNSVGNYWSNYSIRYPDASEVGSSGIGDTPYVIERDSYTTKEYPDAKNIDKYPLMYPYEIENDTITFPIQEPQKPPETIPPLLVATVSVSGIALICAGLLLYFKKRKH